MHVLLKIESLVGISMEKSSCPTSALPRLDAAMQCLTANDWFEFIPVSGHINFFETHNQGLQSLFGTVE